MFVYAISNNVNGKIYIGQHSGSCLKRYLRSNITEALRGKKGKAHLYAAIRKYGAGAFSIQAIVTPLDKEQMDKLEVFFIRSLESMNPEIGYNLTAGGGGMLGMKFSEQSKAKMRAARLGFVHSETAKRRMSTSHSGKKFTAEHKQKIGIANTTRQWSAESRAKLSATMNKRARVDGRFV